MGTARQALDAAIAVVTEPGDLDELRQLRGVVRERTVLASAVELCEAELSLSLEPIDRALLQRALQVLLRALATPVQERVVDDKAT